MGQHATLSASESKKWLTCPGSVKLACVSGASRGSGYARLGTAAHALAARCLSNNAHPARVYLGGTVWMDKTEECAVTMPGHVMGNDSNFTEAFPIDTDMVEAVQVYLDHCTAVVAELAESGGRVNHDVELRCDLSWVHRHMFGTADFVAWSVPRDGSPGVLHVVDYKHGAGVPVEVQLPDQQFFGDLVPENTQLLYYALGVAGEVGFNFREVHLTVVQPRCRHPDGPVRTYVTSVDRLQAFVGVLQRGAARTEQASPLLSPGTHCRWCKAASACPKLQEVAGEAAALDFADAPPAETFSNPSAKVPGLSDDQLARGLQLAPLLRTFLDTLENEAMRRTVLGNPPPGFKLVAGKSSRRWSDGAKEALLAAGLPPEALYTEPKLKGPATVEKFRDLLAGFNRQRMLALVAPLVEKPPGKPKLVLESDPRPALAGSNQALLAAEFDDFQEE